MELVLEIMSKDLELIYQAEYEVDPVDGKADESKGRVLKQRNTFIGIKSSLGTLFLGTHDTALKKSQSKIDLFNLYFIFVIRKLESLLTP